jgi:hypothetical protein
MEMASSSGLGLSPRILGPSPLQRRQARGRGTGGWRIEVHGWRIEVHASPAPPWTPKQPAAACWQGCQGSNHNCYCACSRCAPSHARLGARCGCAGRVRRVCARAISLLCQQRLRP